MLTLDISHVAPVLGTQQHDSTDPHQLLQHGLLEGYSVQHLTAETACAEAVSHSFCMLATGSCQALWVHICFAINRRLPFFGNSEVHQHLCVIPKALLVKPGLQHSILDKCKILPSVFRCNLHYRCEVIIPGAHNDWCASFTMRYLLPSSDNGINVSTHVCQGFANSSTPHYHEWCLLARSLYCNRHPFSSGTTSTPDCWDAAQRRGEELLCTAAPCNLLSD
mmetsp:Transcript_19677/g.54924  ORF Transcript_19677/g.54924 Transcript_19677/m.54924 type:complete len:222 (-) Transcript_19677:45-710(-)